MHRTLHGKRHLKPVRHASLYLLANLLLEHVAVNEKEENYESNVSADGIGIRHFARGSTSSLVRPYYRYLEAISE